LGALEVKRGGSIRGTYMANNTIFFKNPHTGQRKDAPVGFSWTILFFGPFPMLLRGSWKWFAILLILALVSWSLSNIVLAFITNKFYIKDLVNDGFQADSVSSGTLKDLSMKVGFPIPILGISD
jgi:hypothetical protein